MTAMTSLLAVRAANGDEPAMRHERWDLPAESVAIEPTSLAWVTTPTPDQATAGTLRAAASSAQSSARACGALRHNPGTVR